MRIKSLMPNKSLKKDPYSLTLTGTFILGISLLVVQYLYNRSLWLDEAMLSLNIIDKSYGGLLQPLEYSQIAPILFLLIEKLFTGIFGNNDLALRIFPLLCSISSLFLFYHLVKSLTENRVIAIIALFILSCTPKFIYYASEVKQYAIDVFVLLLIYVITFSRNSFLTKYRIAALSLSGAIAVFLSNTSVIVLFVAGLTLLYQCFRQKRIFSPLLVPLGIWATSIAINYLLFIKGHPTEAVMKSYWQHAFMPVSSWEAFKEWFNSRVMQVFYELLPAASKPTLYVLYLALYLGGIALLLVRKKLQLLFICLAPVFLHLVLSAFQVYPFDLRLILYHTPLYIIIIAYAIYQCSSLFQRVRPVQAVVILLFLACFSLALFNQYPLKSEEMKPVLKEMNRSAGPNITLYLYYGSKPAYYYYQKTGYTKFSVKTTIPGESHADDRDGYLKEFDGISGQVWLLFSHVYPFDGSHGEEKHIVNGLQKRGILLKEIQAEGSAAYLFDLH